MEKPLANFTQGERREMLRKAASELISPFKTGKMRARLEAQRKKVIKTYHRAPRPPRSNAPQSDFADQGVYVIGCAGEPIKIGISNDAAKRLRSIQTSSPHRLRIYAQIEAPSGKALAIEQECHRRLADYRRSGEWFDYDPYDAIALIRQVIAEASA